jgi:hypothetical protein
MTNRGRRDILARDQVGALVEQYVANARQVAHQSVTSPTLDEIETGDEDVPTVSETETTEKESTPVIVKNSMADGFRDALIAQFNSIAKMFNLPAATVDSDGLVRQNGLAAPDTSAVETALQKFLQIVKEGREFSKENSENLRMIHHTLVRMMGDDGKALCKEMMDEDEDMDDSEDAGNDGASDSDNDSEGTDVEQGTEDAGMQNSLNDAVNRLIKTFEGLDLKTAQTLQASVATAHAELVSIQREIATARTTLKNLREMPLGRPTLINRSIQGDGVATYEDFVGKAGNNAEDPAVSRNPLTPTKKWTIDEALAQTSTVTEKWANGEMMTYRKWPNGVGGPVGSGGVRPPLTSKQRTYMMPGAMVDYKNGLEALVPILEPVPVDEE